MNNLIERKLFFVFLPLQLLNTVFKIFLINVTEFKKNRPLFQGGRIVGYKISFLFINIEIINNFINHNG